MPDLDASPLSADAAALAWLVEAGADALVTNTPRNWLAPPQTRVAKTIATPQTIAAPAPLRAGAVPAVAAAAVAAAATAALAAKDVAELHAAVAAFDHPLRVPGLAPELLVGTATTAVLVVSDMPHSPDSPAQRLLVRMLAAIGLDISAVAVAQLLPWPTPGGRSVRDDEIAVFAPFAARARALAAPRLMLALGDRAAALSGETRGVSGLRGRWLAVDDVPMLATFHPRRLLTQPELKRLAWADLQAFAARLEALS